MALMFRSVLQSGGGAELIVTCDSEFAGATISCSDGTTTLNKTCPVSSPYEVTFKIPNSGDWTISATVSGTTYSSDPISVDLDYETDLEFGFNWKRWVDTARFLDSTDYSTLSDLLADEEAVRELCLEHACVDYLCTSAVVNPVLTEVIGSDLFAKWVNNSDYALDKMYANAAIKTVMDTADKYGYGEWALMPQVPTMTSDSAPYGAAYTNAVYNNRPAYLAFDSNDSTYAAIINEVNNYLQYTFVNPINIKRVRVKIDGDTNDFKIQVSNDGFSSDVRDIATLENVAGSDLTVNIESDFGAVSSARIIQATKNTQSGGIAIYSLQFYAWQPKGNVPVMTSASAPYGEVAATTNYAQNFTAYLAFNGSTSNNGWSPSTSSAGQRIYYKFTNPICVKKAKAYLYSPSYNDRSASGKIVGSNDGSTWKNLSNSFTVTSDNKWYEVDCDLADASDYYLYIGYEVTSGDITSTNGIKLQFYGRELSVSVPTMTSNTAPYGEVSAANEYASAGGGEYYYPYAAFTDTNISTNVNCWGSTDAQYIGYEFPSPVVVKKFYIKNHYHASSYERGYIQAYVDNDWVNISAEINAQGTDAYLFDVENANNIAAKKIRFKINSCQYGTSLGQAFIDRVQFYGKDYSEKEFEEGTNKKWLYDHGVELETIDYVTSGSGATYTKNSNNVLLSRTAVANSAVYMITDSAIELSAYELVRLKTGEVMQYLNDSLKSCGAIVVGDSYGSQDAGNNILVGDTTTSENYSLDISSINQNKKVYIRLTASSALAQKCTISELWLE